jgi:exosortase
LKTEVGITGENKTGNALFTGKTIILFSLVGLLFAPVIFELFKLWIASEDYSHGFLVMPLSFYMVWRKRKTLLSLRPQPLWVGLPIFVAGMVSYLLSFITKFHTLTHLSMIVILIGLLLFLRGWYSTKELLLPVLFLLFMFPIPSAYYVLITNPMKLFITRISTLLIDLLGVPVYCEGNLLFMASMKLEVAEACSGIRSLYSYLMLGCLFAIMSTKFRSKLFLLVSPVPLAFGVNIFRVAATGVLANYYGPSVSQGFFHEFSGLFLFALGFIVFLGEFYFLNRTT